jgi:hypothetical protein
MANPINEALFAAVGRNMDGTEKTSASTGNADLRERLSGALNDLEAARRTGDDAVVGFAEHRLDTAIHDARQAREQREQQPREEDGRFAGFDGGVRGKRSPPTPHLQAESSAALMLRAFSASRFERKQDVEEHALTLNI